MSAIPSPPSIDAPSGENGALESPFETSVETSAASGARSEIDRRERRRLEGAAAFAALNDWLHAHCFGMAELGVASRRFTPIESDARVVPFLGADAERYRDHEKRAVALLGHVPLRGRDIEDIEAEGERWLLERGLKLTACPYGLEGAWRFVGDTPLLPVAMTRVAIDVAFPAPSGDAAADHEVARDAVWSGPEVAELARSADAARQNAALGLDPRPPVAATRIATRSPRRAARQAVRTRFRRMGA